MSNVQVSNTIDTLLRSGDAAQARTAVGLGNVNNTSDAAKPVSTAAAAALAARAPSGAYINATHISAVKTAVETPTAIFAGVSALANRTALTIRNESTHTRLRVGRLSANLQRDGMVIEPQAVMVVPLLASPAVDIFCCSEGAAVPALVTEVAA